MALKQKPTLLSRGNVQELNTQRALAQPGGGRRV